MTGSHATAMIAIQGYTIQNLMDALEEIAAVAHTKAQPEIAKMADDAIEAAKALTKVPKSS